MRLFQSFRHAFRGLALLFHSQSNARIHALFITAASIAGWLLHISPAEWIAALLAIGLVLASEAFNTALEQLADRVTPEQDPIIRDAKDLAAAAVLTAAIIAAIVGCIVFLPKILRLFANGAASA